MVRSARATHSAANFLSAAERRLPCMSSPAKHSRPRPRGASGTSHSPLAVGDTAPTVGMNLFNIAHFNQWVELNERFQLDNWVNRKPRADTRARRNLLDALLQARRG